jgi:H+-translocating NAD(P) transhydrogenase subunit alpha
LDEPKVTNSVGVPRETFPGERCVALTPRSCEVLLKAGMTVLVEPSAGADAGYPDEQFTSRGAKLASRAEIFEQADIIVQYRSVGANPEAGRADLARMRSG